MTETLNLSELINSKIVVPVQERFKQQKEAVAAVEARCQKLADALEQQKKYASELEQKIADLTAMQQKLQQTLSEEQNRQQEMESAISAINWEE